MMMRLHRVCDKPLTSWPREPYIPLINREWGHYKEISNWGLMLSLGQYIKAEVRNERTDDVIKLFVIWPFQIYPSNEYNKKHRKQCHHPKSFEVVFTERKRTWRCDRNHKTQFLWQREILNLSLRSIKVNNWSADNFEKTRQVNELYTWTSIQSCDTGQRLLFLIAVS